MTRPITAVIADDEEALRDSLGRRLASSWPELRLVGEAANGPAALQLINTQEPDIAFLDIRMPGMDGLEVARQVAGRCHVVFVTAYDEYAVRAFEAEAVDYLLKPVTEARLTQTAARLKQRLAQSEPPPALTALFQKLAAERPGYLRWIRAGRNDTVRMLAVDAVICFIAEDKYTTVHTAEGEFVIRKPIKELEAELDPELFWRIHRKTIVNVGCIESSHRVEDGNVFLKLRGMRDEFPVSRTHAHRFRQM